MPKIEDLTDKKFGKLTVIKLATKEEIRDRGKSSQRLRHWHCICDCGNEVIVSGHQLTKKKRSTKSCGCIQKNISSAHRNITRYGAGSIDYSDV